MSDTTPSDTYADWESTQRLMLGRIATHLRGLGYADVHVVSGHLGWGRLTTSEPYCTDPHYFFADGFIIRVSIPRSYCPSPEASRSEILPSFRLHGQDGISHDVANIPGREYYYELMTYRRGRLYIYTLPPACRARLCVQNALINRRSLFRAAKRNNQIIQAVHTGRARCFQRGNLATGPSFV